MKAIFLSMAIILAMGASAAYADGPNEPTCTGDNCPKPQEDKGR